MRDEKQSNKLVWQIAAGIVLGVTILGVMQSCDQAMRLAAFNHEVAPVIAQMNQDDPFKWRQRTAPVQQVQTVQQVRVIAPMPPDERCIGKQLFRRLPNGFEQVTDGTASLYCK